MVTWNNMVLIFLFSEMRFNVYVQCCWVVLFQVDNPPLVPIIAPLRQSTLRRCRKHPGTQRMSFPRTQIFSQWGILWGSLPHSLWAGCQASQKTFWLAHAYVVWCYNVLHVLGYIRLKLWTTWQRRGCHTTSNGVCACMCDEHRTATLGPGEVSIPRVGDLVCMCVCVDCCFFSCCMFLWQ